MQTLAGHLDLVCSLDAQGRGYISRQSFSAPFHISKSYHAEHALMVQVINPTAGLFAGDRLESRICVERGARLHIRTPSATRIHTMSSGTAEMLQRFNVAEGGWLEYSPAALIPQRSGHYRQTSRVDLETGAELFFFETLAPGRVAHGESFEFRQIDWDFSLVYDKQLIAAERFALSPEDESLASLRNPFCAGYYASGYLITQRITAEDECWEQARTLNSEHLLVGASRLVKAGWGIKILARDSITMQKAIAALRAIFGARIPELRSHGRG